MAAAEQQKQVKDEAARQSLEQNDQTNDRDLGRERVSQAKHEEAAVGAGAIEADGTLTNAGRNAAAKSDKVERRPQSVVEALEEEKNKPREETGISA